MKIGVRDNPFQKLIEMEEVPRMFRSYDDHINLMGVQTLLKFVHSFPVEYNFQKQTLEHRAQEENLPLDQGVSADYLIIWPSGGFPSSVIMDPSSILGGSTLHKSKRNLAKGEKTPSLTT